MYFQFIGVATNSTHVLPIHRSGHKQYTCHHEVLAGAMSEGLVLKEPKNLFGIKKFVSASNERHSSRDTGTILEYTDVTGPNQSGSSWDRPPWTHNIVSIHHWGSIVILSPWHSRYPEYYNKTCTSLTRYYSHYYNTH